jgi:hypothetical protein
LRALLSDRVPRIWTTTLIALLVVNERVEEAADIARRAKDEWDDDVFRAAVDRALEGKVPAP